LLGADRVIAVVPDKERPLLLLDAFADLLDVPREAFRVRNAPAGGLVNRSLSLPETELIRVVLSAATGQRARFTHTDDDIDDARRSSPGLLGEIPHPVRWSG
jgi:hypothetical protein